MMKRFSEDNARGYHNDMEDEATGEFPPGRYLLRVEVDGQNFGGVTTWVRLEHDGAGHSISGEVIPTPSVRQRLAWRFDTRRGAQPPKPDVSLIDGGDASDAAPDMADDLMEMNELSQAIIGEPMGIALALTNPARSRMAG
jgi:hypothetical protein